MRERKQEQTTELKILPLSQLIANLRLLTLPTVELIALVRAELEQNPALEEITEPEEIMEETQENKDDFEFSDFLQEGAYSPEDKSEEEIDAIELIPDTRTSISSELLPTLKAALNKEELPIAEYILGNLNDDGFLPLRIEEVAEALNVKKEKVEGIIDLIQRLSPGLAAKNVKDSLLAQLRYHEFPPDSLEYILVKKYYYKLTKKNIKEIAKELRVSQRKIEEVLENIRKLDPRPGRKYISSPSRYVSPDFVVRWRGGDLVFTLTDEPLPNLRISSRYKEIISSPESFSEEERNFAKKKVKSAIFLLKGIEERRTTLKKMMAYLLEKQRDFFEKGREFLKPLSMVQMAKDLNLHPSTISRAIANKYVDTPHGIFDARELFPKGIGRRTRRYIKKRIEKFITEDSTLTDKEIAEILKREGLPIARRTVAKYRIEIGLPSKKVRERLKKKGEWWGR